MPMKTGIVQRGLKKKGFVDVKRRGSGHRYLRYVAQDGASTSILTHCSQGSDGKEITDNILGKMAKQCKLSRKDFDRLVDCSMTTQDYEKSLLLS